MTYGITLTYPFATLNHWTAAWQPKLVVSYTLPGQEQGASGRGAGLSSLAQQPAPEATPPANQTWRSYYHAAGRRVAMRIQDGVAGTNHVHYLFADHLGSTNVSYQAGGGQTVTQRYFPWGSVRPGPGNALPTDYTYTGQLDSGLGLMYYRARHYDPSLGRFVQPDTIVPEPGNPQALNRYSYVLNNPLRYTDPTGMFSEDAIMQYLGVSTWDDVLAMFGEGGVMSGAWGYLEVLRRAQLGTPISMWFDVGNGFNASQPNMIGMFSEQDGALVFSAAFLDWTGSGGSWALGGLSAVTASTLLPGTGQYQVGSLSSSNAYIGAGTQYYHVGFDFSKVNWTAVHIGLWAVSADIGGAMAVTGAVTLNPVLAQVGAVWWVGANAANWYSLGATIADWQRGQATTVDLSVSVVTTVFGTIPVAGLYFDAIGIGYEVSQGVRWTP